MEDNGSHGRWTRDLRHVLSREAHQCPRDSSAVFDRHVVFHFRDEDRRAEKLGVTRHAQAADILVLGFRDGFGRGLVAGAGAGGAWKQANHQNQKE